MTPLFIEEFKSKNKCPYCGKKSDQKSLCRQHLEVARLTWKIWRVNRRKNGLCQYCHTPSATRSPNCESHREIQRKYQADFYSRNPGYIKKAAIDRAILKDKLTPKGICSCRMRNPIVEGKEYCKDCLKRQSLFSSLVYYKQVGKSDKILYYAKMLDKHRQTIYNKNTKRMLSELKGTRQKLRELGYKVGTSGKYFIKVTNY